MYIKSFVLSLSLGSTSLVLPPAVLVLGPQSPVLSLVLGPQVLCPVLVLGPLVLNYSTACHALSTKVTAS